MLMKRTCLGVACFSWQSGLRTIVLVLIDVIFDVGITDRIKILICLEGKKILQK